MCFREILPILCQLFLLEAQDYKALSLASHRKNKIGILVSFRLSTRQSIQTRVLLDYHGPFLDLNLPCYLCTASR